MEWVRLLDNLVIELIVSCRHEVFIQVVLVEVLIVNIFLEVLGLKIIYDGVEFVGYQIGLVGRELEPLN